MNFDWGVNDFEWTNYEGSNVDCFLPYHSTIPKFILPNFGKFCGKNHLAINERKMFCLAPGSLVPEKVYCRECRLCRFKLTVVVFSSKGISITAKILQYFFEELLKYNLTNWFRDGQDSWMLVLVTLFFYLVEVINFRSSSLVP